MSFRSRAHTYAIKDGFYVGLWVRMMLLNFFPLSRRQGRLVKYPRPPCVISLWFCKVCLFLPDTHCPLFTVWCQNSALSALYSRSRVGSRGCLLRGTPRAWRGIADRWKALDLPVLAPGGLEDWSEVLWAASRCR